MYLESLSIPRNAQNGGGLEFSASFRQLVKVSSQFTIIPNIQLGGNLEIDQLQAQADVDIGTASDGQTIADDLNSFKEQAQLIVDDLGIPRE